MDVKYRRKWLGNRICRRSASFLRYGRARWPMIERNKTMLWRKRDSRSGFVALKVIGGVAGNRTCVERVLIMRIKQFDVFFVDC